MMLPVVALVGRPNVGKSTLFNRLTRSRDALVDDQPGVTRDHIVGRGRVQETPFLVVDTGGIGADGGLLQTSIDRQVSRVIDEADVVLFLVDALDGVVPADKAIAERLRKSGRSVRLLVNKSEGIPGSLAVSEFQELALGHPVAISAKRGSGCEQAISGALSDFTVEDETDGGDEDGPRLALVGRPNVGKSTLANRLIGEYRVIVSDMPGTTRDSIRIPLSVGGKNFILIDTAGVRKKSKVDLTVEKFSIIKTLQAVAHCHVALFLVDAAAGITAQDAAIAGMVNDFGRSIVVIANKRDRLDRGRRAPAIRDVEAKLSFLANPEIIAISALRGSNIAEVIPAAERAYNSAMVNIATSSLNRTLRDAVTRAPPPLGNRRPVKLKFAHQASKNPPVIVIHGNLADTLPKYYLKYLSRYFSAAYRLAGTPVRILTRVGENPFKKRNPGKKSFKLRSGQR